MTKVAPGSLLSKLDEIDTNTTGVVGGDASAANQVLGNASLTVIEGNTNASLVDTGNSSTTPLAGGATFTGAWIEVADYSCIEIAVATNVASATNGLRMEFSPDGVNADHVHSYDVTSAGVSYTQAAELRYFRIVYNNGATIQAHFRLTVILKKNYSASSRYTFGQDVTDYQFADTVKGVFYGKATGGAGGYYAVRVNVNGKVLTETLLEAGTAIIGKVGIDPATNLVVTKYPSSTESSGSGTITTGGVAQTSLVADANGYYYKIQNNSNGDLWFSTVGTAIIGQPSERLPPDAVYETPFHYKPTGALSVIGATTGQAFTVRKF